MGYMTYFFQTTVVIRKSSKDDEEMSKAAPKYNQPGKIYGLC